jgi:predicted phage terminase large subunit-like protein
VITQKEAAALLAALPRMSAEERQEVLKLLEEHETRQELQKCRDDFHYFMQKMSPELGDPFVDGAHLRRLAKILMKMEKGESLRLAVSVAPRHSKSQTTSILFPAWYLGKHPNHKIIIATHTADLAVKMSRKVRNLLQTPFYKQIFPETEIASDAKAAGAWSTSKGGEYFAVGAGGAVAGHGGHLVLVDDPISEQDLKSGNVGILDEVYKWFMSGPRTRLQPGAGICVLHTRWHQRDLIGRLIKDMTQNPEADQYEVFEFPAILDEGTPKARALWSEMWSLESLLRTKASIAPWIWNANYMQNPTGEESTLINREWFNRWQKDDPPQCSFIIMSLDAAVEAKTRSDFNALHTWGVFFNEETNRNEIIMLNRIKRRLEFPELKVVCAEESVAWDPDSFIIELKANGAPLFQELRRTGAPVQAYTPHRGTGDKIARVNSVADIIKDGCVWIPETRWGDEFIDEVASFPAGENDDDVDAMFLALFRFRQGGFVSLSTDERSDNDWYPARKAAYY